MILVSSEFMPHTKHEHAKIIYYLGITESNAFSSYELFFFTDHYYTENDNKILDNNFINSYEKIMQYFDKLSLGAVEGCDVVECVLKKIVELLNESNTFLKIRLDVVYIEKGGGVRQDYTAFCIMKSLCKILPLKLNPKPHYIKYTGRVNFGFDDFDNTIRGFLTKKKMMKLVTENLENESEKKNMLLKIEEHFKEKYNEELPKKYTEDSLKYLKMTEPVIFIV